MLTREIGKGPVRFDVLLCRELESLEAVSEFNRGSADRNDSGRQKIVIDNTGHCVTVTLFSNKRKSYFVYSKVLAVDELGKLIYATVATLKSSGYLPQTMEVVHMSSSEEDTDLAELPWTTSLLKYAWNMYSEALSTEGGHPFSEDWFVDNITSKLGVGNSHKRKSLENPEFQVVTRSVKFSELSLKAPGPGNHYRTFLLNGFTVFPFLADALKLELPPAFSKLLEEFDNEVLAPVETLDSSRDVHVDAESMSVALVAKLKATFILGLEKTIQSTRPLIELASELNCEEEAKSTIALAQWIEMIVSHDRDSYTLDLAGLLLYEALRSLKTDLENNPTSSKLQLLRSGKIDIGQLNFKILAEELRQS